VRVEGEDYRHRGQPAAPPPVPDGELSARTASTPGASCDDFDALLAHLSQLHPSRYGALVDGLTLVGSARACGRSTTRPPRCAWSCWPTGSTTATSPVLASGVPLDELFPAELLSGGYRKKYLRAVSRLTALARQAQRA
jgi:cell division protein ZapE